jgi:hypothetical protein
MTSPEIIEKSLESFLQKRVVFALESKILKKGKLILFCIKDFFCIFTLICEEKNNKKIMYEIPYPFEFTHTSAKLTFDYTVSSFTKGKSDVLTAFKKINIGKPSKLLNKKVSLYTV